MSYTRISGGGSQTVLHRSIRIFGQEGHRITQVDRESKFGKIVISENKEVLLYPRNLFDFRSRSAARRKPKSSLALIRKRN